MIIFFGDRGPYQGTLQVARFKLGHQQMYDLERFYGTKDGFYKGTDSYKSYKLVQTSNFSFKLMPYKIYWRVISSGVPKKSDNSDFTKNPEISYQITVLHGSRHTF